MYSFHLESVEQMGKDHLVGCRGDEKKNWLPNLSSVCMCTLHAGFAGPRLWVKRGTSLCTRDTVIVFLRPFTLGDRKVLATCPWNPQVQGDLSLLPPALERMTGEDWIIEPVGILWEGEKFLGRVVQRVKCN